MENKEAMFGGPTEVESAPMTYGDRSATHYTVNTDSTSRPTLLSRLGFSRQNDENKERGNWTSPAEFFFTAIGATFNMSKLRFAYMMYRNGGGLFLIAYIVATGIIGVPLVFMQLALGQFTSNSPLTCWNMAKMFKGIGLAMVVVSAISSIYSAFILALALYYVFASFTSNIPWSSCDNYWNTPSCSDGSSVDTNNNNYNGYPDNNDYNGLNDYNNDYSYNYSYDPMYKKSPAEEYFNNYVLNAASDILDVSNFPGSVSWKLVLCLIAAWLMVAAGLCLGVKSLGKVMYWTVSCSYLLFFILFIRGVSLPGAQEGIKYYILPSWGYVSMVTEHAVIQVIYEYILPSGHFVMLGSYNKFHNNCMRDSILICVINGLTSICTGFVIFAFYGYGAHTKGVSVGDVATSGLGALFIAIPDILATLPIAQLWCFIFFSAVIYMVLNNQLITVKVVTTCIIDQWPKLRSVLNELIVTLVFCFVAFIFGIQYCHSTGIYWMTLLDWTLYRQNLWILLLMIICVCFVYKFTMFRDDINMMLGGRTLVPWSCCAWGWIILWSCLTFLSILSAAITSAINDSRMTHFQFGSYIFPYWATIIGWCITAFIGMLLWVPLIFFFIKSLVQGTSLIYLVRPDSSWGPALPQHRNLNYRYSQQPKAEATPMIVVMA